MEEECLRIYICFIIIDYFLKLPNCCAKKIYNIYIVAVYKMQFVIVCNCSVYLCFIRSLKRIILIYLYFLCLPQSMSKRLQMGFIG